MSRKKKKRVQPQSSNSDNNTAVSSEKSEAKGYLKTLRFIRKIDSCKTALYGYVHTANIIRWSVEEQAHKFYATLYAQWRTLQKKMARIARSGIFEPDSLKVATANAVYTALIALYLTDQQDIADRCLHHLLPDLNTIYTPSQLAWSGSDKPVVALTLSLIAGRAMFQIEDFHRERLYEDVKELWNFEDELDPYAKCNLAPTPLYTTLFGGGTSNPIAQELCLAVMDKYEVEYAGEFPSDIPVKVCEFTEKGEE